MIVCLREMCSYRNIDRFLSLFGRNKIHRIGFAVFSRVAVDAPFSFLDRIIEMSSPIPEFPVPTSNNTVLVRIVDSTTRIGKLHSSILVTPPIEGLEYMQPVPSWSFLIEHPSGQKALFDMGVPKDWQSFAPVVTKALSSYGWDISVEKEVIDVLEEQGIAAREINSIIWRSARRLLP